MKQPILLISLLAISVQGVIADEHRQHDAHEHGAATLAIAQDGKTLQIEFSSPAYNIVGFEHAASTDEDKKTLATALGKLNDGSSLFAFPESAKCTQTDVNLHASQADEHEEHDHDEHDEHEHEEHEEHDHDEHEQGESHSEVDVVWTFSCTTTDKLTNLNVALFSAFPNLVDLDVDYLTNSGQGSVELSPSNTVIKF
jgi:hypothetical protein